MLAAYRNRIVLATLIGMLAATLLAWYVLRRALRPVREIATRAAQISPDEPVGAARQRGGAGSNCASSRMRSTPCSTVSPTAINGSRSFPPISRMKFARRSAR